jgi:hypothetical protein
VSQRLKFWICILSSERERDRTVSRAKLVDLVEEIKIRERVYMEGIIDTSIRLPCITEHMIRQILQLKNLCFLIKNHFPCEMNFAYLQSRCLHFAHFILNQRVAQAQHNFANLLCLNELQPLCLYRKIRLRFWESMPSSYVKAYTSGYLVFQKYIDSIHFFYIIVSPTN